MSSCCANSASVLSPRTAARATFALKAGVWFRRGRLVIVSPGLQPFWLLSGRNSTYPDVQISWASSYPGPRIALNPLRRRYPVSLKGVTLRALIQVASHLHLAGRPLRFELSHLRQLRLPAIVHWDMSHFVVLKAVTGTGITVHDPALGEKRYSIDEASKHLTGVALELTPSAEFSAKNET